MMRYLVVGVGAVCWLASARAEAQVAQPGQSSANEGEEGDAKPESSEEPRYQTVVEGTTTELDLVGPYRQPRWTTRRRFPTTRVYVRPRGDVEFEWWLESKFDLSGDDDTRWRSQYELEVGLGHRLQLDLYLTTEQLGDGPFALHEEKVELRYALADWGVIPSNPTFYVEWVRQNDGPYKAELKGLFGGALASKMYWGVNGVYERELGGEKEQEYALTAGLARVVVDRTLSAGAELKLETVDVPGDRLAFDTYEVLAGPSLQWLAARNVHIDLVALFGFETEGDTTKKIFEPTIVVGADI